MTKIIIKKTSEEITYQNITKTTVFEINGKEVRVYSYDKQDNEQGIYETDTTINEGDLEKLTELEHEVFGENLSEWLELETGTSQEEVIN